MEGRFTLALLRAVRSRLTRTGAIALLSLCVAPLLAASVQKQVQAQAQTAKPTAINPAPPSVRRPDLELGRQGGAVAELQAVLQLLGFYKGEVNGVYNEATSLAVVRFQEAAQLPQTGRVSTRTWNALFPLDTPSPAITTAPAPVAPKPPAPATPAPPAPQAKPSAPQPAPAAPKPTPKPAAAAPKPAPKQPAPKPNPYPTLKLGEKGDAVVRLQRQLRKKGFLDGQPDGAFGPMTEAAVKEAQEALGLEIDGVVGPATWQALLK